MSSLHPPALVITENQTAGRGRGKNQWLSQSGALTFSLVINPNDYSLSAVESGLCSLMTAAVVRKAILYNTEIPESQLLLKWPNDLYLQERKVCGILLEKPVSNRLIIGIGLNVNNSSLLMDSSLQKTAVSISDVTEEEQDLTQYLASILNIFQEVIPEADQRSILYLEQWQRYHLLVDRLVTIQLNPEQEQQTIIGHCLGIDEAGALLVRDELTTHRIFSGVVQHWE